MPSPAEMQIDGPQPPDGSARPTHPANGGTANTPVNRPCFRGTDWLSFGITVAVTLAVYLYTIAPDVTLGYSGMLSVSASYGGVAHPPGYPVWTIYSWLSIKVFPFSNIAWRVAVGSAVAASLASGLVALLVSRGAQMLLENNPSFVRWQSREQKLLRLVCGSVAGMALAFSNAVWSEAVVADIWTLAVLLFTALLCLLLRWVVAPHRKRFLYGSCLILGSLVNEHQELITAAPAFLLLVILADPKLGRDLFLALGILTGCWWCSGRFDLFPWFFSYTRQNWALLAFFMPAAIAALAAIISTRSASTAWKPAALCAILLLSGFAWCLYLPIASMSNPPVNWGYPRTFAGFFHVLTRGQYEMNFPTHDVPRFFAQFWMLAKKTGHRLGWMYMTLAALPLRALFLNGRHSRLWLFSLMAFFLCVGPLLLATLNPSADSASMELYEPYFAAMFVVLGVFSGLGLVVLAGLVTKPPKLPSS